MTKIDYPTKSQDSALLSLMATSMMIMHADDEAGISQYLRTAKLLLREIDRRYRLNDEFAIQPFGREDGRELLAVSASIMYVQILLGQFEGTDLTPSADSVIDVTESTLEQMKHVPRGILIQMPSRQRSAAGAGKAA